MSAKPNPNKIKNRLGYEPTISASTCSTLSYTILLEEMLGEKKCRQKHGGFRPLLTPD